MFASTRSGLLALTLVVTSAMTAPAQRRTDVDDTRWLNDCRDSYGNDDRRACEVRNVPVRLTSRQVSIDARENGGMRVMGWDGDTVRVTARIQANSRDESEARNMLRDVKISSDGRRIWADGPERGRHETWSVSYVLYVPRTFDLQLEALNGGIGVSGVTGKMELRTINGSVSLTDVSGDVRAHTQNGSLNVTLAGNKWDGAGLDAETQNGSVRMEIPSSYAALIETQTVNGRLNTDFPVTVQGRIGRSLSVPLNGGGKTLRVTTTNGSVTLSRR